MKKILYFIIGVLVILVGATSCSDEDSSVSIEEKYTQQTILMYLPWTGDVSGGSSGLYRFFLDNIDSVEAAIVKNKGTNGCRILVYINDRPQRGCLYEIKYGNNRCIADTIQMYSGNGFTSSNGIAQIVGDAFKYAPALNYAMTIGCHGSGWTYKEDWVNYPSEVKGDRYWRLGGTSLYDELYFHDTRFYGSVSKYEGIQQYGVNIETLAEGLKMALNEITYPVGFRHKLQYLLFDDCYMCNMEIAYQVRDVTNFMVASTSEVMAFGMPYRSMWSSMHGSNPSYSGMVNAFNAFYTNYSSPYGSIAAIDCRKTEDMAAIMKEINKKYTLPDSLRDSIQCLDGMFTLDRPGLFFDMKDYVDHLYDMNGVSITKANGDNLYTNFCTTFNEMVVAKKSTPYLYTSLSIFRSAPFEVKKFNGITLSDFSVHPVALIGKEKTAWWKATH
jgi:hypothetical protein